MNESIETYFVTPPLIYMCCFFASMGMVVSTVSWLYGFLVYLDPKVRLFDYIRHFQIRLFVCTLLTSIFFNAVKFFLSNTSSTHTPNILPEIIIFLFILFGYQRFRDIKGPTFWGDILKQSFKILQAFFICIIGWIITFLVALGVFYFCQFITGNNLLNYTISAFVAGSMWNVPVLFLYYKIRNLRGDEPIMLKNVKFHDLLWPVLLAYALLILPLLIQDVANSKGYKEMLEAKPRLRKA